MLHCRVGIYFTSDSLPTATKLICTRVKKWLTVPRGLIKPVLEKCPTVMEMALGAFVSHWLNNKNKEHPQGLGVLLSDRVLVPWVLSPAQKDKIQNISKTTSKGFPLRIALIFNSYSKGSLPSCL